MSIRYFTCNCHLTLDKVCPHDNDPFNARRMRTDWTVADFDGLSQSEVNEINKSNARYNDLAEGIEEMNMTIAMRQIDDGTYERKAKGKDKTKRYNTRKKDLKMFDECPDDIMADLEEFGFDFE